MVLRRGDSGPVVRAVQQAVGTTGDGLFGQHTQAAVRRWQTARSLPATGVVSADTWRALLVRNAAPAPTTGRTHPELTRYAGLTLRMGSHGRAVTALQHRLYYRHAGGRFGAGTSARVRVFQRRHHLPATGVVAARTWRALGA
jgi:peptidoglycan hydrolase-like protein with peptidoglycan-binding domain